LREEAIEYLADSVESTIATYCVSDYAEEWDLDGLLNEVSTSWPSSISKAQLEEASNTDELYELLMGEAQGYYEQREEELGPEVMRQVERQIMLQIIDQKWREHLYEMDYLQEGIHLRAMGQKDPLVEWQREGFDMFGLMMHGIAQDFVKYVMHAQVTVTQPGPTDATLQATNMTFSGPDDPSAGTRSISDAAAAAARAAAAENGEAPPPQAEEEQVNVPIVKSEWDKTPRNAPCPCGSGKKFKMCHGR
jgi:preprotein translocase subunit SecA